MEDNNIHSGIQKNDEIRMRQIISLIIPEVEERYPNKSAEEKQNIVRKVAMDVFSRLLMSRFLMKEYFSKKKKKSYASRERISIGVDFDKYFITDVVKELNSKHSKKDLKGNTSASVGIEKDYREKYHILLLKDYWGMGKIGNKEYLAITAFLAFLSRIEPNLFLKIIPEMQQKGLPNRIIVYLLRCSKITASKLIELLGESRANVYRWKNDFEVSESIRRERERKYVADLKKGIKSPKIDKNVPFIDGKLRSAK